MTAERSASTNEQLAPRVASLWGTSQRQQAPVFAIERTKGDEKERKRVDPDSSTIDVSLSIDFRRKGLLCYRTYTVDFDATYQVAGPLIEGPQPKDPPELVATVFLPCPEAVYDNFSFTVDGVEADVSGDPSQGLTHRAPLKPGEAAQVHLQYASRGLDSWAYAFGNEVSRIRDFSLTVTIASIVPLAFLMHATARVDWEKHGGGTRKPEPPPPLPQYPPVFEGPKE